MTLRAAVWKSLSNWAVDSCPADEYDPEVDISIRAFSINNGDRAYFTTHAKAMAYAKYITHKEQE